MRKRRWRADHQSPGLERHRRGLRLGADLCRWLEERFAKTYHPSSMTRVLRRMGFSRQKARPSHPRRDAEAQERFKKGGFADILQGDRRGASRLSAYIRGFRMKRPSATRAGLCHR